MKTNTGKFMVDLSLSKPVLRLICESINMSLSFSMPSGKRLQLNTIRTMIVNKIAECDSQEG